MKLLLSIGSISVIIQGIAHLFPTRTVVKGFGQRILKLTLPFLLLLRLSSIDVKHGKDQMGYPEYR